MLLRNTFFFSIACLCFGRGAAQVEDSRTFSPTQQPTDYQILRDRNQWFDASEELIISIIEGQSQNSPRFFPNVETESFDEFDSDISFNNGRRTGFDKFVVLGIGDATIQSAQLGRQEWNFVDTPPYLNPAKAFPNNSPQLAIRVCNSTFLKCGNGLQCSQGLDFVFQRPVLGWGAWMGPTASSFQISVATRENSEPWNGQQITVGTNSGFVGFLRRPARNNTIREGFTRLRIGTGECWGGANTYLEDMVFLTLDESPQFVPTTMPGPPPTRRPTIGPSNNDVLRFFRVPLSFFLVSPRTLNDPLGSLPLVDRAKLQAAFRLGVEQVFQEIRPFITERFDVLATISAGSTVLFKFDDVTRIKTCRDSNVQCQSILQVDASLLLKINFPLPTSEVEMIKELCRNIFGRLLFDRQGGPLILSLWYQLQPMSGLTWIVLPEDGVVSFALNQTTVSSLLADEDSSIQETSASTAHFDAMVSLLSVFLAWWSTR